MAHKGFVIEVNRPAAYGQLFENRLRSRGFRVQRVLHKTTFVARHGSQEKLRRLHAALRSLLHQRSSSVVLFGKQTGRAWIMRQGGNRPGVFVSV